MKIAYLSNSIIPSRTANSIHVMKMCQAFAKNGHEVDVIASRRQNVERHVEDLFSFYGAEDCFNIVQLPWPSVKGKTLIYGYRAARKARDLQPDLVYCRDLIGCYFAASRGMRVVFESHAPADKGGRILRWMFQRLIRAAGLCRFVVITHALKDYYLDRYPFLAGKIQVAPDGADPASANAEPAELPNRGQSLRIGYVGHLYSGRGIDIVERLAQACSWADFHIVGGTDEDIAACKARIGSIKNLFLHGFKSPVEAERYRLAMDVLLAPYQQRVLARGSGARGSLDTAKWMSPLKLFEYMAAGKAIVCSDLPVLREILTHNVNSLLVPPSDPLVWASALLSLRDDLSLRTRLGAVARAEFLARYTWAQRAANVLRELPRHLERS